ncbi:helix-turn-helix domain-containing protein [Streptomyces sp. NPDC127114]|uniref:ArsR/SmtB family transcription factor n=1 Tax=Streptomyces sp. NPDC127114 TaxID=3345366 RepID=UPI003627CF0B
MRRFEDVRIRGASGGGAMMQLTVNAAGLARSRFAVSPLQQVTGTLMPWGLSPRGDFGPWLAQARRSLRRAGLPLLSTLALEGAGYLPDFLSPYPTCPAPTIEDELELVAATDPERVMRELEFARRGRPAYGLQGIEPSETLRRAMSRGGRHVARQAATELRRYWQLAFAPQWKTAKSLLDAEVDRRASTIVRYGAGDLFNSIHSGITWNDDTLRIESRFTGCLQAPLVVLIPSLVAQFPAVAVDPLGPIGDWPPLMVYPVSPQSSGGHTTPPELARLVGSTRAGLLTALDRPATTAELATRYFLSPATVSYHLGILRRSGLVSPTRDGRYVLYRRTAQGARLVTDEQNPR